MRKRITRCLALLLAVVMVLSVMPVAMAEETAKTATLVTDASTLKDGDEIILVAEANEKIYAAGKMSGKYLSSVETTVTALDSEVEIFKLNGTDGKWTLTGTDGKRFQQAQQKRLTLRIKAQAHGRFLLPRMEKRPLRAQIRNMEGFCIMSIILAF